MKQHSFTTSDALYLFAAVLAVFAAVAFFGGMIDRANHPDLYAQSQPVSDLGDQLIFPEGWTPIDCESSNPRGTYRYGCEWVCVKDDQLALYRYCTPTVESNDPSRGD